MLFEILISAYSSMVEQRTHNSLVTGSNPVGRTFIRGFMFKYFVLLGIVYIPLILSSTPNWITDPDILESKCTKISINSNQVIYTCEVQ